MTTRRLRTIARPTLLLTAAFLFAGCGQRGDLYLPTPQKTAVSVDAARRAECVGPGGEAARDTAASTGCAAPAK